MALALLAGTASLPAVAQTDPVGEARALQGQGKAEEAYQLLKPLEGARAGDPAFDYALGVAAADSNRPGEALIALQRVLAVEPGNAPARAELARVYALMGDIDTARAEFDTVVGDPTVPDPVRERFTRLIRGFDRQIAGGANEVTGFLDLEGGWDSNINAATDETSILLPAFAFLGPATLNGAATERGEPFVQLQGGVSASTPLGRQTRLFGSLLGSWRDNLESSFVDQGSIVGSAGVAHTLGNRDVISLAGQAQEFLLDGKSYRTSFGAIARYTMRLPGNAALSFSGDYFRLNYDNNPLADANRFGASVTYSGREIFAGIGAGREQTVRAPFDHLSNSFISAQAGGEFLVMEQLSVIGGIGIEHRNHDGVDPLFLAERKDTRFDASLGFRVLLTERVSLRPRLTYSRNESNLALYDYDRWTASAGLRFEF
ncbi:tetratricopeptide repeat protein [Sphingomonas sp. M1-B02]|uniref:tetratricopeptide repeat protein n=1 Tax=Sphingomonas sp. M1-B02 TaxID=3114300 RepID=UPI0022404C8B|nr:tetratricopeptide repeat protein [Sphingomonas sp. S6-11]UZK67490.1 tetratricopeptide repeat protein [Sphingomonas sp. S6-11]